MKLEYQPINIEKSEDFKEESFSIADVAIVIDILRSKLYSNPIKVLVQEYMSNARDAHREVGNEQTPIEVVLPTIISPQFEVRDFGPGITPDRMKNVFIKYAASTKRDTNNQTGGYGLGCKSGWSYSDAFNVVSITNEQGFNIKRSYTCIVDDSRCGKLVKMDEVATDEPCGVRIVVPCKKEDFVAFKKYAKQAGAFWDVAPIIHGETHFAPGVKSKGKGWTYFNGRGGLPEEFAYDKTFVIYDGIPYPLKVDVLKDKFDSKVLDVLNNTCFALHFNIGEIAISANREEIHYTEKTRLTLIERINQLIEDFSKQIKIDVSKKSSFREAFIAYNKLCDENNVLANLIDGKVSWNGITIREVDYISDESPYVRVDRFYDEHGVLRRSSKVNINLSNFDYSKLYINDDALRGAPLTKMKSLYYNTKDKTNFNVYVVSFSTNNTKGFTQAQIATNATKCAEWRKSHCIDHLDLNKTSSLPKNTIPKGVTISINGDSEKGFGSYRIASVVNDSDAAILDHSGPMDELEGYYIMTTDGRIDLRHANCLIRDRYEFRRFGTKLKVILDHLKIKEIYVFNQANRRQIKDNENLIELPHDILEQVTESADEQKIKEYNNWAIVGNSYQNNFTNYLTSYKKWIDKLNKDGEFLKNYNMLSQYEAYKKTENYKYVKNLFAAVGGLLESLKKVKDKSYHEDKHSFNNRYPLLRRFESYSADDNVMKHAIDYINMVDNA